MGNRTPEQDRLFGLYLDNLRAEPNCGRTLVRKEENFDLVVPMQTVIGMDVQDVAESPNEVLTETTVVMDDVVPAGSWAYKSRPSNEEKVQTFSS